MTPRKSSALPSPNARTASAMERTLAVIEAGFHAAAPKEPRAHVAPQEPQAPQAPRPPRAPQETSTADAPQAPQAPEEPPAPTRRTPEVKPLSVSADPNQHKVSVYLSRQTRARADMVAAQLRSTLSALCDEGLRRLVAILEGESEDPALDLLESILRDGLTPELRARAKELTGL